MDFLQALLIAVIASFAPTVMVLAALIINVRMMRKLEEVRHNTNSLTEALVKKTGESERAKGIIEGRAEGKGKGGG